MTDREVIKKHNAAIHITNDKMSLLQRKLFNVLVWRAYPHLTNKEEYEIELAILLRMSGYDSTNTEHFKRSVKKIASIQLEWNLMKDSKEVWGFANLLSDCEIKDGICNYSIPPKLRRLLYNPDVYTLLQLNITKLFKSKYSLTLYENCYRYINTEHKTTGWIGLELFRKLIGADTKLYIDFNELKRRVIEPSVEEVNEISNILLTVDYEKKKRKVTGIKFGITLKDGCPDINQATNMEVLDSLVALLPDKFRGQQTVQDIITTALSKHGQDRVSRNIRYSNAHSQENYPGFLYKAIEADWGKVLDETEVARAKEEEYKRIVERLQEEDRQRKIEEERRAQEEAEERYNSMSNTERFLLEQKAKTRLNGLTVSEGLLKEMMIGILVEEEQKVRVVVKIIKPEEKEQKQTVTVRSIPCEEKKPIKQPPKRKKEAW